MNKESRIAVFPGSFDPMTIGHLELLRQAAPLFDKIIVAIGTNTEKKSFFPLEQRMERIEAAVSTLPNVEVATYSTLTTDFCKVRGARFMLRGLRSTVDFEYERNIAEINRMVAPDIETVFLLADPRYAAVSSSMVRELMAFGKDASHLMA